MRPGGRSEEVHGLGSSPGPGTGTFVRVLGPTSGPDPVKYMTPMTAKIPRTTAAMTATTNTMDPMAIAYPQAEVFGHRLLPGAPASTATTTASASGEATSTATAATAGRAER